MTTPRPDPLAKWRAWRAQVAVAVTDAATHPEIATPGTHGNPPPSPAAPSEKANACTDTRAIDLGELPERPCQMCGGRMFWRAALTLPPLVAAPWLCEACHPPDPDQWRDATCIPEGLPR